LVGKPKDVGDGYIVFARLYQAGTADTEDPVVEETLRMVFVNLPYEMIIVAVLPD
jgi:hypothetical protein